MVPCPRVRLATLLLSLASTSAWAQSAAEGSIRGYVKDNQDGALPGVVLTATSPAAATPSTVVTDGQGFYRLLGLTPGEYVLTASLSGFAKYERTGIEVRAEVNIQVDVTMELGKIDETITVAMDTPMLEVQKTVQAINISGEFMKLLPLSSRRVWQDVLDFTPGIMSRSTDRIGAPVYFLRGTENENHVVQVDGADAGSFRLNFPGFFLGLSSEAVSDVQIKTAGVDAAAPLAAGMVINIATPSGTNELKGSLAAVYTARGWNGNNTPGGTPVSMATIQPDGALGGPLVKNVAWFFGTFRYTKRSTGISRNATQLEHFRALVPSFEPFDNEGRLRYYSLKVNTQFGPNHQFQVLTQRDRNREDMNFQVNGGNFDVSAAGGSTYAVRLTSVWGSQLTTRVLASYNDKGPTRVSMSSRTTSGPAGRRVLCTRAHSFRRAGALDRGSSPSSTGPRRGHWTQPRRRPSVSMPRSSSRADGGDRTSCSWVRTSNRASTTPERPTTPTAASRSRRSRSSIRTTWQPALCHSIGAITACR